MIPSVRIFWWCAALLCLALTIVVLLAATVNATDEGYSSWSAQETVEVAIAAALTLMCCGLAISFRKRD